MFVIVKLKDITPTMVFGKSECSWERWEKSLKMKKKGGGTKIRGGLGLHQHFLYIGEQQRVIRVGLERITTFNPSLG